MKKRDIYYVEELYVGRILKIIDGKETISNEKVLIYSKDLPKKTPNNLWEKIKLQFDPDNIIRRCFLYPYKVEVIPYNKDKKTAIEKGKSYVVGLEKALRFLDDYFLERGYLYDEDMVYTQNKLNGVTENDNLQLGKNQAKQEKVVFINALALNALQILEKRFSVKKMEYTQLLNYGVQVSAYLTSLGYSVKFENAKDGLYFLRLSDIYNVTDENGSVIISFNESVDIDRLEIDPHYSSVGALRVLEDIDKGSELHFKYKNDE